MSVREDTIVAPATPPGRSAIALVRLSGTRAREILDALFAPARGGGGDWKPWRVRSGWVVESETGKQIDRGMAVWQPGPATYTGEDAAEITCHGSPVVMEEILRLCLRHGARLAEPGEFTRRAFMNGRIDLAEAEAVCDLIAAQTESSLEVARRQLRGDLSERLNALREKLIDLSAEIEAWIDFPDEEIPEVDAVRLSGALQATQAEIAALLAQGERGRRLREGARVVIAGDANVGKSSLFNAICKMERAITTPHPGTTRDTIETRLDIGGLAVDLVDTAGVRPPESEIEEIGIGRTKQEIERADLVLWTLDATQPANGEFLALLEDAPFLVVLNKCDLLPAASTSTARNPKPETQNPSLSTPLQVSAKTGEGIEDLESRIREALLGEEGISSEAAVVSNLRHIGALGEARDALSEALAALERRESVEFVMVDLRTALDRIGAILGLDVGEEVLDRIFARFCLGK